MTVVAIRMAHSGFVPKVELTVAQDVPFSDCRDNVDGIRTVLGTTQRLGELLGDGVDENVADDVNDAERVAVRDTVAVTVTVLDAVVLGEREGVLELDDVSVSDDEADGVDEITGL